MLIPKSLKLFICYTKLIISFSFIYQQEKNVVKNCSNVNFLHILLQMPANYFIQPSSFFTTTSAWKIQEPLWKIMLLLAWQLSSWKVLGQDIFPFLVSDMSVSISEINNSMLCKPLCQPCTAFELARRMSSLLQRKNKTNTHTHTHAHTRTHTHTHTHS